MLSLVLLPVALAREARLSTRLVEESAECSTSAKTQLSAWYTAAWQTRCRARTELFGPAPPFNEDAWLFAKTGGACELVIPSDNQRFEAPLAWTYSGGTVTPEKTEPTDNEFCEAGGEYGIVIEAAAITIALREVDDAATACKLSTDAAATSAAADSPLYGLAESIAGGVNLEFLVIIGGGHVAVTVTHTFQEIDADSPLHVGFAMSHVNREHLKQQVCAMASVSATNRRLIEAHNERYARGEETFAMTVPWRGAQDGTPPAARSMGHAAMPAGSMPADGRRLSAADILTTEQLATMPASWDYRKVHPSCIFRAQSQRQCGSCWAFATLGAFEKQICAVTNGNYKPQLSRQNLVDCNKHAYACGGGNSHTSHPVMSEIGMATSTVSERELTSFFLHASNSLSVLLFSCSLTYQSLSLSFSLRLCHFLTFSSLSSPLLSFPLTHSASATTRAVRINPAASQGTYATDMTHRTPAAALDFTPKRRSPTQTLVSALSPIQVTEARSDSTQSLVLL